MILLLYLFAQEIDKSFLDNSIFLTTNIFCNIFYKLYFLKWMR